MSYRAPVPEMLFTLRHVIGLDSVDPDDAEAILSELSSPQALSPTFKPKCSMTQTVVKWHS